MAATDDGGWADGRVLRLGIGILAFVAWFVASPAALWGNAWRHHEMVVTPVVVFGIVVVASLVRERPYRRLTRPDRRRVDGAVRSGTPVGDAALDTIVHDRLQRAAASAASNRLVRPVLAAVFIAVPIVAAVRVSPWFLLALPCTGAVVVPVVAQFRREDARDRLARFLAADGAA